MTRIGIIFSALLNLLCQPALAQTTLFSGAPTVGHYAAGVNINAPGSGTLFGTFYINALKSAGAYTFNSGDTPAALDDDGYPIATLAGVLQFNIIFPGTTTGPSTFWILKSPSTRSYKLHFNGGFSNHTESGCTVSSNGFTTDVTTGAGQSCRVRFSWSQLPTNLSVNFAAGAFYSPGSGEIALLRESDEAAYDAGTAYFIPEAVARIQELAPRYYRMMTQTEGTPANFTNLNQWRYRTKLSNITWNGSNWFTGAYGGTVSGTNAYTVTPPADDTGTLVDGQVIQGTVSNAGTTISVSGAASNGGNVQLTVNASATLSMGQSIWIANVGGTTEANGIQSILSVDDSTHITINVPFVHAYTSGGNVGTQTLSVSGRAYGVIFIANASGGITSTQFLPQITAAPATFVYNSVLNRWLYSAQGITRATPVEVKASLANAARTGLWDNVPMYANNDYVTQAVTYYRDHLNGELWLEYDNEGWNTAFPVGNWMYAMGGALGWSIGSAQSNYGWYGLRVRQIHGAGHTAWNSARTRASYHGVLGVQAFGDVAATTTNRFNGSQLNGASFPIYCAYVGGSWSGGVCTGDPGYNAAPNRPIDFSDTVSYAPYTSGANIIGPDTGNYSSPATGQATFLQNLVNLVATGAPADMQTALALVDNDLRQGTTNTQTVTIGGDNQTFTIPGTNYASGNMVVFTTTGSIFTGISLSRPYFVISPSGSTFKVSLTSGGSAVTGISGGSGTQSVGRLGSFTLAGLAGGIYPGWETAVATYDSARAGFVPALLPIRVESYEGGPEPAPPTTAQCTSMGVTISGDAAAACAALSSLITTYKNNGYAQAYILSHFKEFMGTESTYFNFGTLPHSTTPTNFEFGGDTIYSLLSGNIFSAPYQTWEGFKAYQ